MPPITRRAQRELDAAAAKAAESRSSSTGTSTHPEPTQRNSNQLYSPIQLGPAGSEHPSVAATPKRPRPQRKALERHASAPGHLLAHVAEHKKTLQRYETPHTLFPSKDSNPPNAPKKDAGRELSAISEEPGSSIWTSSAEQLFQSPAPYPYPFPSPVPKPSLTFEQLLQQINESDLPSIDPDSEEARDLADWFLATEGYDREFPEIMFGSDGSYNLDGIGNMDMYVPAGSVGGYNMDGNGIYNMDMDIPALNTNMNMTTAGPGPEYGTGVGVEVDPSRRLHRDDTSFIQDMFVNQIAQMAASSQNQNQ